MKLVWSGLGGESQGRERERKQHGTVEEVGGEVRKPVVVTTRGGGGGEVSHREPS